MSKKRKIANNCEKATFLIEKKKSGAISIKENLELSIHLAGCSVCRIFQNQSKLIDMITMKLYTDRANRGAKLDDQFKKELHERIEGAMLGKNL